jgi:predicted metalloprotease with PDZ domain
MKAMYEGAYEQGRGFSEEMWWEAVRAAANGRSFERFHDAYIDGRDAFPWAELLPLAGLEWFEATTSVARIGISSSTDETGVHIVSVVPGGSGALAGVQPGDDLIELGGIVIEDASFGARFRARYGNQPAGTPYDVVVDRAGERLTLSTTLQFADVVNARIQEAADANEKALRIRNGILTGSTGR